MVGGTRLRKTRSAKARKTGEIHKIMTTMITIVINDYSYYVTIVIILIITKVLYYKTVKVLRLGLGLRDIVMLKGKFNLVCSQGIKKLPTLRTSITVHVTADC